MDKNSNVFSQFEDYQLWSQGATIHWHHLHSKISVQASLFELWNLLEIEMHVHKTWIFSALLQN